MKILAFDTTNKILSISLLQDAKIIGNFITDQANKQAEYLLPKIEELLKKFSLEYADLDILATATGPGSFTGIRIGLSALKAINLVLNKKSLAVNLLEIYAYFVIENIKNIDKPIYVILDAKRGQLCLQKFDNKLKSLNEPSLIEYDYHIEKDEAVIIGQGADLLNNYQGEIINIPQIIVSDLIAKATYYKLQNNIDFIDLKPFYIREPDAKKALTI